MRFQNRFILINIYHVHNRYLAAVLKIFNQVTGGRTKALPTTYSRALYTNCEPPNKPIQAMSGYGIAQKPILEIACFNQESAVVAAGAGADRIE